MTRNQWLCVLMLVGAGWPVSSLGCSLQADAASDEAVADANSVGGASVGGGSGGALPGDAGFEAGPGTAGSANHGGGAGGGQGGSISYDGGQGAPDGATADDAGVGIGSKQQLCQHGCERLESAGCSNTQKLPDCVDDCLVAHSIDECEAQSIQLLTCEATTSKVVCDAQDRPEVADCSTQRVEFLECMACAPASADDSCDSCLKSSCCDERKAVVTDEQFEEWYDCALDCGKDSDCFEACGEKFPEVEKKFFTLKACSNLKCKTECQ